MVSVLDYILAGFLWKRRYVYALVTLCTQHFVHKSTHTHAQHTYIQAHIQVQRKKHSVFDKTYFDFRLG